MDWILLVYPRLHSFGLISISSWPHLSWSSTVCLRNDTFGLKSFSVGLCEYRAVPVLASLHENRFVPVSLWYWSTRTLASSFGLCHDRFFLITTRIPESRTLFICLWCCMIGLSNANFGFCPFGIVTFPSCIQQIGFCVIGLWIGMS